MNEPVPNFSIRRLGDPSVESPLRLSKRLGDLLANYVTDEQRVAYDIELVVGESGTKAGEMGLLEKAGPRERIYFDPKLVHAGIVTCGGLCPGLNNVIRSVVMTLWHLYGVRRISGIRYGYSGMFSQVAEPPMDLSPDAVSEIHRSGGTILGSGRGGGDKIPAFVDEMVRMGLTMLFAIGGDGTQRGALAIADEIARRGLKMAVVGIPKTIDNDLSFVERSFGFDTAVSEAVHAVEGAHTEARGAINGVGIVKVMGRESGFIAVDTALATNDVNYVLIPEVPFDLEGERGFITHLERRLEKRHHAVVLVAEGAGQNLVGVEGKDASGNQKLGDIGLCLKERIAQYFKAKGREVNLKYIDPSYIIRSSPANPADAIYCARLGSNAVHAAMAGRTACLVGLVNSRLVHVPIGLATERRNHVDPESSLWRDLVESTGQPPLMVNG